MEVEIFSTVISILDLVFYKIAHMMTKLCLNPYI